MPHHSIDPTDLPNAIDRALDGRSILVLPRTREGAIAEVDSHTFAGEHPPALILRTSGSTGAPKAVALSAKALTTSARATERFLSGPGVWYLTLPVNHIAGFQVEFRAHLAGRAPIRTTSARFTAATFTADVEQLLDWARDSAGPSYTSLVPTQLHRVLDDPRATRAAAGIDAILLGGSAVPPALLDRAEEAGLRIVRTYGMSETAGGCVYDGVPFDGVDVTITEAGTIDLRGDVVADSYVEFTDDGLIRPVASSDLTVEDGVRTMHTSDLGRLDVGVLSVLGRADDIIVSGGTNVSPHALETELLRSWQNHAIAEVLVTSVPDDEWGQRVVALVRLAAEAAESVAEAAGLPRDPRSRARHLNAFATRSQGQFLPHLVFVVPEIPLRSIGKPDRRAAAVLAANEAAELSNTVDDDPSVL
ncbi:AMP-binding protein [Brevibacterium sp.]|uniref:AMP-binding protein n=1 Tax=Brevibacterium sp. TaxID=1701 RepID=UPI0028113F51|nr:AMP-binding protein [Brevibacterium sp.]